MAYMNGIDVSNWQAGINLSAVQADFVIMKATQGTWYVSPDCDRQYQQAKKAGRCLGVYHYAEGGDYKAEADYFIKNVKDNLYNGLLFHRVIKQFMIQAGDINSKDAPADKHLGDGDPDYTVPAEIVYPKHFHKAGALCAARTSDDVNPERASSASQFYIVTGKFFTEMELDKMEKEQNKKFTAEQREAYMLEGGRPDLDDKYTVFGEVVSGMKTVFKIQMVETNTEDRPLKNIKIKSMKIVEK